jgi:hypothetical protein
VKGRLVRAVLEISALPAIYGIAFLVVRETRLTEVLLASGAESVPLAVVAAIFVALRLFVVLFLPGWVASVLFVRVLVPALRERD